jgi:hypothetical protein
MNKWQQYSDLKRSQHSIIYYTDLIHSDDPIVKNRPRYYEYFYPSMLVDDLGSGILPISQKEKYSIRIEPENLELEKITTFALSQRDYCGRNLIDVAYWFFKRVTMCLASYNECFYEIVELLDPQTEQVQAFDLSPIQPMTVFHRRGRWVQYVPNSVSEKAKVSQYIPLPEDRLLIFRLPKRARDRWIDMMEALVSLNGMPSDFGLPSLEPNDKKIPANFKAHHRLGDQAIAKLTREIGWNMRKYPHDGMLEYYWFHRFLLFEKFKIELREAIVTTLNDGLARIGKKLGMQGQIVIKGLPTLKDVAKAQEDLKTGQRSAREILNQFRAL